MKFLIAFSVCVAVAVAAYTPSHNVVSSKDATVLRYDSDNIGVEGYNYAVETSDGKSVQEQGHLENVGTDHEALVVRGSFKYVGADGVTYTVTYTADENGFQPQGAHLPQAH